MRALQGPGSRTDPVQVGEEEEERSDPAEGSLAALFRVVCARQGTRIAVTLGAETLTYDELDRYSDRIAAALVRRGAKPGTLVAICLERSTAMLAAMLGVVKSGAAYLPVDAGYPATRIAETIEDAAPLVLLTTRCLAAGLGRIGSGLLFVEELSSSPAAAPMEVPVRPGAAAYVIYTSGSTGRPKGVVVSQHNVMRLLRETQRLFHFDCDDVWTMFHSFAFDFSVWEIWACLLSGGRLVIVPYAVSRSPEELHALLIAERVTVLNQTPSAFALLDAVDQRAELECLSLRLVIFGGESLQPALLRAWIARHGDARPELVNMYGITETTVHVSWRRMLAADADSEHESLIGEPLGDVRLHLLDERQRPVADGEEGELWIGGGGVALGYLNRPTLTAERFRAEGLVPAGGRLYRSGDRARRRADGELVYLGRRDSQVKINGFRIELGEVEAAILGHPALVQACVTVTGEASGGARLAAYYVAKTGPEPSVRALSEFLAERLPSQMMPAFYIGMPGFPLTPNGKIDRLALPPPHTGMRHPEEAGGMHAAGMHESGLENRIARIWRRVLKAEDVGRDDDFFDVGGNSLLLIAVRTGLQEQLDRSIPVTSMFEHTTIRALARHLEAVHEPSWEEETCKVQ